MKTQSIIRVTTPGYVIVVYQDEQEGHQYTPGITLVEVTALKYQDLPMHELAEKLFEIPTVAVVEVTGWDKNGIRIVR